MKKRSLHIIEALSGTYGQVFFSDHKVFAVFLALASFIDPFTGFSGLICALFSVFLSWLLGLNSGYTRNGTYSFNALLSGLALGSYFKLSADLVFVLLMASALTLLLTVWLSSLTSKYKLPFLSLPFIFATWIIFLNTRSFEASLLQVRTASDHYDLFKGLNLPVISAQQKTAGLTLCYLYFKTMAAVFFQTNVIAGFLIVVGLVIYSRIAFVLSIAGFVSGYFYFSFVYGSINVAHYSLTASSYILSALGLGGFFLVASGRSFLLVIFSAPIIGLFAGAFDRFLLTYNLPLYSLPFSITVIIILTLLNNIFTRNIFQLVQFQQFSPEKNLYTFYTFMARFKKETQTIVHLPFFGEWTVSQGHNGDITHKDHWRFAWDFVVKDEYERTFKYPGKTVTDFFCYGLPVLSPADGEVVTIDDGIDDNEIGNVNLAQNWGNTIIIKHSYHLYSKLSHLKKGSFKVKQGDAIKKGEILALCGNSGRSPEPHIHFQMQATAELGAASIDYPISYYGRKIYDTYQLHFFDVPGEHQTVIRPVAAPAMKKAFNFIPGTKFSFLETGKGATGTSNWEVRTDAFNNSYIECETTGALAYFKYDETIFYFTGFSGNKKTLLYYFYLGAYKVLLSEFKNLKITDKLSIEGTHRGFIKILQDVLAPFYIFLKPNYCSEISEADENKTGLKLKSRARSNFFGKNVDFEIGISDNRIQEIKITEKNTCRTAQNIPQ